MHVSLCVRLFVCLFVCLSLSVSLPIFLSLSLTLSLSLALFLSLSLSLSLLFISLAISHSCSLFLYPYALFVCMYVYVCVYVCVNGQVGQVTHIPRAFSVRVPVQQGHVRCDTCFSEVPAWRTCSQFSSGHASTSRKREVSNTISTIFLIGPFSFLILAFCKGRCSTSKCTSLSFGQVWEGRMRMDVCACVCACHCAHI